jgi:catechol 2,3-dioxygenase-like lactoylglutathione lyase family enzyme
MARDFSQRSPSASPLAEINTHDWRWQMTEWFARPVLHVRNVNASLRFYVERLGFTVPWRVADKNGHIDVAQVDRQGCAVILAEHWPEKVGKGLLFISLNIEPETHDAAVEALDGLRAEFQSNGVAVKDGHWGYRVLVVEDLDGNQLFFNYPNEPDQDPEGLHRGSDDL